MNMLREKQADSILRALALILMLVCARLTAAQSIPANDIVRLSEAYTVAEKIQEKIWTGWNKTPFTTLLVTGDFEYLIRAKSKPDGFQDLGWNQRLNSSVYFRKRTFDPNLLATFPAFDANPVIVIGTAEKTGKNSTLWILTLLHEHFHQYQMSDPDYFPQVDALGLSGGDQSGMWMLNYPFPYESKEVIGLFTSLSKELALCIKPGINRERAIDFWKKFRGLEKALSANDFRYLSFQLWQEGIARYTELRVAETAASSVKPSNDFAALPDFQTFKQAAESLRQSLIAELRAGTLREEKRVAFYPFGAAIGLLLDQTDANWHRQYNKQKFSLHLYPANR